MKGNQRHYSRRTFLKKAVTGGALATTGPLLDAAQENREHGAAGTPASATGAGKETTKITYPRQFTGNNLRMIAFPLGGIGTGTISLGGRGQLRDWEIFNRPGKGKVLPYSFFSIWARPRGGAAVARVLERQLLPSYVNGAGLPAATVSGLPRLR